MDTLRFLYRNVPRAGLAVAAIVFVLGQRGPYSEEIVLGPVHAGMETSFHQVTIACYPSTWLPSVSRFIEGVRSMSPLFSIPGVRIWGTAQHAVVEVSHTLTCLLFLAATLLTSSRPGHPVRPSADSTPAAQEQELSSEEDVPQTSWRHLIFDALLLGMFLLALVLALYYLWPQ